MDRYLIISDHSSEDCLHILDLVQAQGYLHHYDWGCKDGEHKAWIVVEVDSKDEARAIVPPAFRSAAKVVQLNAFTIEEIEDFLHQYKP